MQFNGSPSALPKRRWKQEMVQVFFFKLKWYQIIPFACCKNGGKTGKLSQNAVQLNKIYFQENDI